MELATLTQKHLRQDIPHFKSGDTIVVKSTIKEGTKERIQAFEGVVIKRAGSGIHSTFTVRKISSGVGVERVFPVHSPRIVSVERKMEGFVRRSRIYYLRDLSGKAARIQNMDIKRMQSQGAAAVKAKKKSKKVVTKTEEVKAEVKSEEKA